MATRRSPGTRGPEIGCPGHGAMVLEGYSGASDDDHADDHAVEAIHQALDGE